MTTREIAKKILTGDLWGLEHHKKLAREFLAQQETQWEYANDEPYSAVISKSDFDRLIKGYPKQKDLNWRRRRKAGEWEEFRP